MRYISVTMIALVLATFPVVAAAQYTDGHTWNRYTDWTNYGQSLSGTTGTYDAQGNVVWQYDYSNGGAEISSGEDLNNWWKGNPNYAPANPLPYYAGWFGNPSNMVWQRSTNADAPTAGSTGLLVSGYHSSLGIAAGEIRRWVNPVSGYSQIDLSGTLSANSGATNQFYDVIVAVHNVSAGTWDYLVQENRATPGPSGETITTFAVSKYLDKGDEIIVAVKETVHGDWMSVNDNGMTLTYHPAETVYQNGQVWNRQQDWSSNPAMPVYDSQGRDVWSYQSTNVVAGNWWESPGTYQELGNWYGTPAWVVGPRTIGTQPDGGYPATDQYSQSAVNVFWASASATLVRWTNPVADDAVISLTGYMQGTGEPGNSNQYVLAVHHVADDTWTVLDNQTFSGDYNVGWERINLVDYNFLLNLAPGDEIVIANGGTNSHWGSLNSEELLFTLVSGGASTVPEPATALLMCTAAIPLLRKRLRRAPV